MDSNKKITNGWILCPSKSFPGKFYYFNVINGETAWCLSEAEKKALKREINVQKIANKSHSYPEPSSPPIQNIPNNSNIDPNIKKCVPNISKPYTANANSFKIQHPTPLFGQAVLPKTLPTQIPYVSNIFWTPIQIHVPMFVTSELGITTTDQITPTFELDRELFVQTCNKPLCQRFENYENPVINFNKDNKVENQSAFNKFFQTSTPIKRRPSDNQLNNLFEQKFNLHNNNNIQTKHSQFTSIPSNGDSDILQQSFSIIQKTILNRTNPQDLEKINTFKDNTTKCSESRRTNSESEIFTGSNQTLTSTFGTFSKRTLAPIIRVDKSKKEYNNLDKNDLRMFLVARKRKAEERNSTSTEEKKIKGNGGENPNSPKKKVSFNFDNITYDEIETMTEDAQNYQYNDDSNNDNIKKPTIEVLKKIASPSMRRDRWYIIVDTDILLEDFEFIDNFVQTDVSCHLLIPSAIFSDIKAISKGECRGRHRAILARQLVRRLEAPPSHIIVKSDEPKEDLTDMFTIDSILNCCSAAIEELCHVVIVTNDTNLYNRAKSINIHCYKLQDIKDGAADANSEVSFNIRMTNDYIDGDSEHSTQDVNRIPVHTFKKQLFVNDKIEIKEQMDTLLEDKSEAQKPAVNFDKLIDITKLKFPKNITRQNKICAPNQDSEVTETANEIGRDLQNLNLKENHNLFQITREVRNNNPSSNSVFNFQENAIPTPLFLHNDTLNLNHDKSLDSNTTVSFYFQNKFPKPNLTQTTHDFRHSLNRNQTPCISSTNDVRNKVNSIESQAVSDPNQTISFYFQKDGNSNQNNISCGFPRDVEIHRSLFDIQYEKQPASPNGLKLKTNELSIEKCLNRYYVKNKTIAQKIKARIDEWICSYRQIMEEALSDILQNNDIEYEKEISPPWNLYEAAQCVKNVYGEHQVIEYLVDKLCPLLVDTNSKIKSNINPNDFMKIIGCSVLLIQYLKNILPKSEVLLETESLLNNILHNIEDLTIEPQLPSIIKTPVISRSEIAKTNQEARRNFVKTPTDIINYLKKHYEQWGSYGEVTVDKNIQHQNPQVPDVKIVRTFGKNLNLLKIDKSRSMTMNKPLEKGIHVLNSNTSQQEIAEPKFTRQSENIYSSLNEISKENVNNIMFNQKQNINNGPIAIRTNEQINPNLFNISSKKVQEPTKYLNENDLLKHSSKVYNQQPITEPKVIRVFENVNLSTKSQTKQTEPVFFVAGDEYDYTTHGNTFERRKIDDGPKVVRNVKLIATFEEKLKKKAKEPIDLDVLDYSAINQSLSDVTNDDFSEVTDKNDNYANNNARYVENKDHSAEYSDIYLAKTISNKLPVKKSVQYIDSLSANDSNITINDYHAVDDLRNNDNSAENNDRLITADDVTIDSGFESESLHAHSLVKSFLIELSSSFKIIYKFIDGSITEYRNERLCDDKKRQLQYKANKTNSHITVIIDKLKSIIIREANEGTALKALLIKAGVQASSDKRMIRYRQVVTKCLEQAQMLQNALKMLLSVMDGDFNTVLTEKYEPLTCNVRYFNIFE